MSSDLFPFRWDVDLDGYTVLETTEIDLFRPAIGPRRYLTHAKPRTGREQYLAKVYSPLVTQPGLFREFADLALTEPAVLAFANRYGLLGGAVTKAIRPDPSNATSQDSVWGEAVAEWFAEIVFLRNAARLWDWLSNGDYASLGRHIKWRNASVSYDSTPEVDGSEPPAQMHSLIASPLLDDELFRQLRPGDLTLPTLLEIQRQVNERLRKGISPQLLIDGSKASLAMYFVPSSLIGAMWLQLSEAIAGHKTYRDCRQCGHIFELRPDTARTNRVYCSNACKTKAYRLRPRRAPTTSAERP